MNHHDDFKVKMSTPRPGPEGANLAGATTKKGEGWDLPVLRAAKMFAWQFALWRAGSEARLVLNCDWASIGITAKSVANDVRRLMPYLDEIWSEYGRSGTPEDQGSGVINRLRYMYKNVDTRLSEISCEHPLRSQKLMPFCQVAIDLYVKGKPIPRETIQELFKAAA